MFMAHRFDQHLQIVAGGLVFEVPIHGARSPAVLTAMLQAAQLNLQLR